MAIMFDECWSFEESESDAESSYSVDGLMICSGVDWKLLPGVIPGECIKACSAYGNEVWKLWDRVFRFVWDGTVWYILGGVVWFALDGGSVLTEVVQSVLPGVVQSDMPAMEHSG